MFVVELVGFLMFPAVLADYLRFPNWRKAIKKLLMNICIEVKNEKLLWLNSQVKIYYRKVKNAMIYVYYPVNSLIYIVYYKDASSIALWFLVISSVSLKTLKRKAGCSPKHRSEWYWAFIFNFYGLICWRLSLFNFMPAICQYQY